MISFKKLAAQEMVDRGIHRYFFISKSIVVILLIGISLVIATTLSKDPVITQVPYSSE